MCDIRKAKVSPRRSLSPSPPEKRKSELDLTEETPSKHIRVESPITAAPFAQKAADSMFPELSLFPPASPLSPPGSPGQLPQIKVWEGTLAKTGIPVCAVAAFQLGGLTPSQIL